MASTLGKLAAAVFGAALMTGCAGIKEHRGFVLDKELAQGIQVGVDNKDSVTKTLGTVGYCARAAVYAVIGWSLIRAPARRWC